MKIITVEELAAEDIREPALEAMHRAIDLFRPFILPFIAILKEETLTWKEELEVAKEYRERFEETGCFLWSPEGLVAKPPVRIRDPQELILGLRDLTGTILVQQGADVKKSGTAERLPDGGLRIVGREGIPGSDAEIDIVIIGEDGGLEGGEGEIMEEGDITLLKDAFATLPDGLKVHWAIDGGLHVVWAEAVETVAEGEPESAGEKEEEKAAEGMGTVDVTSSREATAPEVRFTATEIYAEFRKGESIPDYVDGLIIPHDLPDSVSGLPERYGIFLKIDEGLKEELDEIFRGIGGKKDGSVNIILPPICNPEEVEYMRRIMEKYGLYRSRGFRVMATIRHPCALLVVEELAELSDGLYVDLPALIDEMYGEALSEVKGAYLLPLSRAISIIQNALQKGEQKRAIYFIPPGADNDIPAMLVKEGSSGISCTPSDINRVVDAIAREEHRLLLRNVGLKG